MAELSEDVKRYIVQALACFDSPKTVSEAVAEEFGVRVERMQVAKYDPTKVAGKGLSKKWRALFDATREEWRKGAVEVPIANRMHRLRLLDRFANKLAGMKNYGAAMQALKQAAEEVGDVYVNKGRAGGGADGDGETPTATKVVRGVKSARKHDDGQPDV